MLKIEKILIPILLIGVFLQITFSSLGSLFYMLSLIILAVSYAVFGSNILKDIKSKANHKVAAFLAGLFYGLILIGIVFRIIEVKAYLPLLFIGITSVLIFVIPLYLKRKRDAQLQERKSYLNVMIVRSTLIAVFGLFILVSPSDLIAPMVINKSKPGFFKKNIKNEDKSLNEGEDFSV